MEKNVKQRVKTLCALAVCTALAAVFFAGCENPAGGKNPGQVLSSEKQLLTFKFEAAKNPGLTADAEGIIDETLKTVSLRVPQGTDITKLKASFTAGDKAQVFVKNKVQASGVTENDFTPFVSYMIKAEDGSSCVYRVQVDVLSASGKFTGKSIAAFGFSKALNPDLSEDVTGFVTYSNQTKQRFIYLKFPIGTTEETLKSLKPVFTASAKAGVSVKNKEGAYVKLESGVTAADFYTPGTATELGGGQSVGRDGTYIKVTAETGESNEYSVQVEIDLPNPPEAEVQKYFRSYYGELNSAYFGKNKVAIVLEKDKVTLYSTAMSMDYVNVEWEKKNDGSYTCTVYRKGRPQIKYAYGAGGYDFTEEGGKITIKTNIMGVDVTLKEGEPFVWKPGCGYNDVTVHI